MTRPFDNNWRDNLAIEATGKASERAASTFAAEIDTSSGAESHLKLPPAEIASIRAEPADFWILGVIDCGACRGMRHARSGIATSCTWPASGCSVIHAPPGTRNIAAPEHAIAAASAAIPTKMGLMDRAAIVHRDAGRDTAAVCEDRHTSRCAGRQAGRMRRFLVMRGVQSCVGAWGVDPSARKFSTPRSPASG